MIACYILFSPSLDKFYTGITQEDVETRLEKHNSSRYGIHFTSRGKDWQVFLIIPCASVAMCLKMEKHIKKMKSRIYIQNLKRYPEMVEKLIQNFSRST